MLANEMILFYHVVRLKSFSQAAEKLEVSKAFVSKHINQLEKDLKTRLLSRNTRGLTLTESGEAFYRQCEQMFELMQKSYENVATLSNRPIGTLKISMPPALALYLLNPPIAEFQINYPEVKLNIVLESKIIDMVQEGYDLAIRSATLPDSNLIARKLIMLNYVLCATPQYLKTHGKIDHPDQLPQHRVGSYSTGVPMQTFEFTRNNRQFKITVDSQFQCNQLDLILQMVTANCCMAVLPKFMVNSAIANGQLIECLAAYQLLAKPLYLIYPQRDFIPLKVKLFMDMLKDYFAKLPSSAH